jgi:hypothetical protein
MTMKIIRRKQNAAGEIWKDHVLARLKEPRCWICAQVVREVDRDLFWFASEQYYEPRVVDKMRLAYGFCPAHTRHFLATGSHSVSVAVFCYLTWYAIKQLDAARNLLLERDSKQDARRLCLEAAAALRPQGTCPMCQSLRQTEMIEMHALLDALANREVKDAYETSPGVCVPHLRQAGYRAEWDAFTFLTQDLQRRLEARMFLGRPKTGLLEQTVGLDRESAIRQRNGSQSPRQSLANSQRREIETHIEAGKPAYPWSQTFGAALAWLAEPGCPVCIACAEGTQQYLDWLSQQMETRPSSSGNWDLSWNICPSHLWDLNGAGHEPAALLLAEHMMHDWLAKLDRLATGLKHRPAELWYERLYQGFLVCCGRYDPDPLENSTTLRRRWSKVASVLESPRDRLNDLRSVAFRSDLCQACLQIQTTTKRRLELILRLLEDPLGRKAYQSGWGLCLRHCIEAAKLAEVPSALVELLSAQIARLRLLEWELEEASRKDNWSVRYEPKGPESDVWRRAAYQFCGV